VNETGESPGDFIELLLGFPAWLLFRRHRIRSWSAYAMGGAALGMTYSVAYSVAKYVAAKTMRYQPWAPLARRTRGKAALSRACVRNYQADEEGILSAFRRYHRSSCLCGIIR
jgi:hypothetical protein